MTIHDFLKERGYQGPVEDHFKDHAVYFYRRIPNTSHQWLVYEYCIAHQGKLHYSYNVQIVYETFDGVWTKSEFYGLQEEVVRDKLEQLEQRLYNCVTSMGGDKKDYRGSWEKV